MKRLNSFSRYFSYGGIILLVLWGLLSIANAGQLSEPHGTLTGNLPLPSELSWSVTESGESSDYLFKDKYGIKAEVTIEGGLSGNVSVDLEGQGNIEVGEIPGSGNLWFSVRPKKLFGIPLPFHVLSSAAMSYKAGIWSSFTITVWVAGNEYDYVIPGPSAGIELKATQSFYKPSPYLLGNSVLLSNKKFEELFDIPVASILIASVNIGVGVEGEASNSIKGKTLTTNQGNFTSEGEKKTISLNGTTFTVNNISERLESTANVWLSPVATIGLTIDMLLWEWDFDLKIPLGKIKVVDNHVKEFTTNSRDLTFKIETNSLTVSKVGEGSILVNDISHSLPWTGQFISGSSETLKAVPASGYDFSYWSGDLPANTIPANNPTTIPVTWNRKVTANFKNKIYTLSLSKIGNGEIKVNGKTYALPWTGQFPSWTDVTIEAIPDLDWGFSAWAGDLLGNIPSASITMGGPKSITAQYFQETIIRPTIPTGPTQGIQGSIYYYTFGGSSSNLGHSLKYLIDWGDNTNSGWLPVGKTTVSKAWTASGTFAVKVMAQCVNGTVQSDWSDSLSVTILNITAGTTMSPLTFGYPFQRKGFYAHSLYWLFYSDGAQMVCKTSPDGLNWSSPKSIRACNSGEQFSIWFDKTYVHYSYTNGVSGDPIWYRRGTPNPDGSISWSTGEQMAVPGLPWVSGKTYSIPCIAVDSNGYPWIGYRNIHSSANTFPWVTKSNKKDGTWATALGFPFELADWKLAGWVVAPIPSTDGKMLLLYTSAGNPIWARSWKGTEWEGSHSRTTGAISGTYFSAVAQGSDVVHLVFLEYSDLRHTRFKFSTNSLAPGPEPIIQSGFSGTSAPVLSIESNGDLHLFWAGSPKADHIYYKKYSEGQWDTVATDWIDESVEKLTRNESLTSFYQAEPSKGIGYLTRKPSPYKVKFNRGY